ncbi:hypothetical protein VTK56DRAFT_4836 [Thermocarpiscus australiensis]
MPPPEESQGKHCSCRNLFLSCLWIMISAQGPCLGSREEKEPNHFLLTLTALTDSKFPIQQRRGSHCIGQLVRNCSRRERVHLLVMNFRRIVACSSFGESFDSIIVFQVSFVHSLPGFSSLLLDLMDHSASVFACVWSWAPKMRYNITELTWGHELTRKLCLF